MDLAAFADAGSVVDHGPGADPAVVADHHIAGDVGERLHRYVLSEFRVGMDVCLVAYHVRLLFIFNDLGHHRGFAGERFADEGLAFDYGYASSDGLQQLNFEVKGIARNDLALEFYAVDLHEIGRIVFRIRNIAQYQHSAALRHGFDDQHSRHDRLLREVSHEERFVHRDVLDAGDHRIVDVEDTVHQQKRRAVGQHAADIVDVVNRRFAAVVLEAGFLSFAADSLFDLLHELRVGEMAGAGSPYAALDAFAEQSEVPQQVEELVAGQFVVETKFQVVQVAARDADILFVEDFLEVFELIVRDGILHNDDGIVRSPPLIRFIFIRGSRSCRKTKVRQGAIFEA